jgi:large subunit ribosomal protein L22
MTRDAARDVERVLSSAVANAEANHNLDGDDLYVSVAVVGAGPTLKRWRARARGRVARIKKRTCHITIALALPEGGVIPAPRPAPAPAPAAEPPAEEEAKPKRAPARKKAEEKPAAEVAPAAEEKPKTTRKRATKPKVDEPKAEAKAKPKPKRTTTRKKKTEES